MEILNLLGSVSKPSGMWVSIIRWIQSGVGNYALTIILLTLGIKIILLPFDFYQRYLTKVNAQKQAKIQPELDKLNARYANNKEMLNQKTMELYKRENYNIVGTCVGMLTYMVITMVVFFTMFSGINKMQYYNIDQEYLTLQQTFITTIDENYDGDNLYNENGEFNWAIVSELDENIVKEAETAVLNKYNKIKTSFLWIKNVWIPDNYKAVIPSYSQYLKNTNQKANKDETVEATNKLAYETVMTPLINKYHGVWNGYMILPVLAMGTTVVSMLLPQWIEKARAKRKGLHVASAQAGKGMMIIMPIILGLFTFFYNSVFALYIVMGAIFGLITSPLITLLAGLIEGKRKPKVTYQEAEYSRRAPVDITNNQPKKQQPKNKNKNGELKGITRNQNNNTNKSNKNKKK